ncbi:hypothetical protein Tco_0481387 [Tanacetum coccineum]
MNGSLEIDCICKDEPSNAVDRTSRKDLLDKATSPLMGPQITSLVISVAFSNQTVIKEYLVKVNKMRAFWSLNEDILKIYDSYYQYVRRPARHIQDIVCEYFRRYQAWFLLQETPDTSSQWTTPTLLWKSTSGLRKKTATYGKIWCNEDVHDLRSVETEFPAIVFDDSFTSEVTPSYEPTVSHLNDNKIDFRISFDESDNEDYTVIYDKNSFSYKIISKTDSENDNEKVNMHLFPSPKPMVSYLDDFDFFKDFENEFSAIVYNDALTSKSDFLTEPTISPQHIDEFDLNGETSLSECDKKEQNVLYLNDLFSFNVIYPDDSKSDEDNMMIKSISNSLRGSLFSAQSIRRPQGKEIDEYWWRIYKFGNLEVLES